MSVAASIAIRGRSQRQPDSQRQEGSRPHRFAAGRPAIASSYCCAF